MSIPPNIRRRMAGCVALMESPNAGEAQAAKAKLAQLESKYGKYIAQSTASRTDPFAAWSAPRPPEHPNCRSGMASTSTDIVDWTDADMADLAAECARWLWLSGWYCQMDGNDRWNVCPDDAVGDWIKHGISNADLIRFAHEKGFGMAQIGEAGDRLTQYRQAISAPEFDISKAKPGERAPRKNFDPKKAPNKKGYVE